MTMKPTTIKTTLLVCALSIGLAQYVAARAAPSAQEQAQPIPNNIREIVFEAGLDKEKTYKVIPSPQDATLYHVFMNGAYSAPKGSLGVRVLARPYRKVVKTIQAGDQSIRGYADHGVKNSAWLVAYPTGEKDKYLWGGADRDFKWVDSPRWRDYKLMPSQELKRSYTAPKDWAPEWLLLQDDKDGAWFVSALDRPGKPMQPNLRAKQAQQLFDEVERLMRQYNDRQYAALRDHPEAIAMSNASAANQKNNGQARPMSNSTAQYENAKLKFNDAVRRKKRDQARYWAFQAGGDTLRSFLNSGWSQMADFRAAAQHASLSESERGMYSRKAADQERNANNQARQYAEREAQREASERQAAEAAYWANREAARRQKWRDWQGDYSKNTRQNANAVRDQAYKDNMKAYKEGHTNVMPVR